MQRLIERRDSIRADSVAAFPMRNLRRNHANVGQPRGLHLLDRPLHRPIERGRSAEPGADAVTEVGQPVIAFVVCERGGDKLIGRRLILLREVLCAARR